MPSGRAEVTRENVLPGHGPMECRATDAGFELGCRPDSADKSVVLQVSRPRS
jgi:hypothetical protein